MSQFLNEPTSVVTEMLESFVQSHPGVQFLDGFPDIKVVVRSQLDKTKVAVISGATTYDVLRSASDDTGPLIVTSLVVRFFVFFSCEILPLRAIQM